MKKIEKILAKAEQLHVEIPAAYSGKFMDMLVRHDFYAIPVVTNTRTYSTDYVLYRINQEQYDN